MTMPICSICRFVDYPDEFVEILQRNQITFQRFGALFSFAQFKARAAKNHFAAMLDISRVRFPE